MAQQDGPVVDIPVESISEAQQDSLYEKLAATVDQLEQEVINQQQLETIRVAPGWWKDYVPRSLRSDAPDIEISLEEVLYESLANSQQIKVFNHLPSIRATAIVEADAAFDWFAFLDTQWDDLSDPVGNSLTAGPGISRFRDHNLYGSAGLRKRTVGGGQFEIAQRFGWQDNNSQFFVPDPQGTSRISLNFTQPLLRGRGKVYNKSLICLAQIDHQVSKDELMRQTQTHLLEVSRAYWAIYLERGVLYQKLRTYERAQSIVGRLRLRQNIDASLAQIQAAEAALANRRSDLARAIAAVKNAEARLRTLVNGNHVGNDDNYELIPMDPPSFDVIPVNLEHSLSDAIQHRPEVSQGIRQIKAAAIRVGMAKHEMLPVLNLVTSTYVAGLADDGDIGAAWGNQFDQGEPGYGIGLQYEVPIGNRAACARKRRRQLELSQSQHQYQVTLNTVALEVKVAVREVTTAQRELLTKQQVVLAREAQLDQIVQRWERLPGNNATTNLVLDNILRSQDDLAQAEYEYLQAQITYNLSRVNLRKATGTLIGHSTINAGQPTTEEQTSSESSVIVAPLPDGMIK